MRKNFFFMSCVVLVVFVTTSVALASLKLELSGQLKKTVSSTSRGIQVIGNLAYVAGGNIGLRIIDVSNPKNPQEVGFLDIAGYDAYSIHVLGNYAYIASAKGLWIVDITNPVSPRSVGSISTCGYATDVYVAGGYAYVTNSGSGFEIFDVSDPNKLKRVGFYCIANGGYGIHVVGDYAYLATNTGLSVVDVSNPRHPREVKSYKLTGNRQNSIQVIGNHAYMASGTAGIYVMDISDPLNVQQLGKYDTPDEAYDVYVTGGYAYVADNSKGLRVLDISNPASITEVDNFVPPKNQRGIYVIGGYAYLLGEELLHIIRCYDPGTFTVQISPPSLTANGISNANVTAIVTDNSGKPLSGQNVSMNIVDGLGNIGGVKDNGDGTYTAIYTASFRTGIETIRIGVSGIFKTASVFLTKPAGHLPPKPGLTLDYMGSYKLITGAQDLQTVGDYAYLANQSAGLRVLNISDPENPKEAGFLDETGDYEIGIHVVDNLAYIANHQKGIKVIDITIPGNPKSLGTCNTEGVAYGIYVSGKYAYVADSSMGLQVIDVSNPSNLQKVGFVLTGSRALNLQVVGDLAYVAGSDDKDLSIINISNPKSPRILSSINLSGSASGIHVIGNRAYIASEGSGIYVVDISDPSSPKQIGSYNTPGSADDVYVSQGYAYVADREQGLRVLDVSSPGNILEVENYVPVEDSRAVYVSGGYVYLAATGNFYIFKIKHYVEPTMAVKVNPEYLTADGISTATVTATLRDAAGNPLIGENLQMFVSIGQGKISPVKDNKDGTYTATYTSSKKPGTETISVTAMGLLRTVDVILREEVQPSGRELIIPDVTAAAGSIINIPVNITDASGVAGVDISLKYDKNILTALDVETTALSHGMTLEKNIGNPGEIIISMAKQEGIVSGSGPLLNIKFRVSDNAVAGTKTNVIFIDHDLFNANGVKIIAGSHSGTVTIGPACTKGDVNNDGKINSADAVLALRIATKLIVPTPAQECAADANSDGKINSADAIKILRTAAGLAAPGIDTDLKNNGLVNLSLMDTHGVKGEIISLPLKADNISALAGGDITITYNPSVLQILEILSSSDALMATNVSEPGIIRISFATNHRLSAKILAEIKFQVLIDGISQIEFQTVELYNPDIIPLNYKLTGGYFKSWATPAKQTALLQNFPNPFNPETWIPYQLKEGSNVKIHIYSAVGELIRELDLGYKPAGYYVTWERAAYWDGKDKFGSAVSSGIYYYSIQANGFSDVRKMMILK